jgi:hypothetical protein
MISCVNNGVTERRLRQLGNSPIVEPQALRQGHGVVSSSEA